MTVPAGTSSRHNQVGAREDLEDVIWDLFPEDTYLLSNLDKVTATNTFHEWQTDSLAGATANRVIEGDDTTHTTLAATVRMGNYCQISKKEFIVSGTLEAARMAGRKSELARAAMKKMKELKRDMELALIGNQASSAGGIGTARSSGGIESWIPGPTEAAGTAANAVIPTSTATSATTIGFASGVVTAPTDGSSTGAFTVAALNTALQGAWEDGGMPSDIFVGAKQKQAIDGFTSIATRQVNIDRKAQAVIHSAANVFVSDFGTHTVHLHRYMRSSVALCLDLDYWAVAFYRKPFTEDLAKTGDATKKHMLAEYCLVARNPNASSKVVALS